jgi:hypothetical protein
MLVKPSNKEEEYFARLELERKKSKKRNSNGLQKRKKENSRNIITCAVLNVEWNCGRSITEGLTLTNASLAMVYGLMLTKLIFSQSWKS